MSIVSLLDQQGHEYHVVCEHAMVKDDGACRFCNAPRGQVIRDIAMRAAKRELSMSVAAAYGIERVFSWGERGPITSLIRVHSVIPVRNGILPAPPIEPTIVLRSE